ncbi:MAG: hypothetical protein RL272_461 [Candidatus Parcubacteria bacterium]
MSDDKTESKRERLERLKRKFMGLSKIRRLIEYVRYRRARDGDLPHPYPQAYVDDVTQALWEMVCEDYPEKSQRARFIDLAAKRASEPFLEPSVPKKK